MSFFNPSSEKQLLKAAETGNLAQVENLIAQNVNIDAVDENGRTALHLATYEDHTKVAEALIEAGANPNHRTNYDSTPLISAAGRSSTEIVRMLIEAGADINIHHKTCQRSALYWAVTKNQTETAKLLIEAGADTSCLSAEQKEQYKNYLFNTKQPYSLVNDYTVSKYEGEIANLGRIHLIFNFQAGTVEKTVNDTLGPKEYFHDLRAEAERDDVTKAYEFIKATDAGQNLPPPFYVKKAEKVLSNPILKRHPARKRV